MYGNKKKMDYGKQYQSVKRDSPERSKMDRSYQKGNKTVGLSKAKASARQACRSGKAKK